VYNWGISDPPSVNYSSPNAAGNEIGLRCTFRDSEPSAPDYVAAGMGLFFTPMQGGDWRVTPRADINASVYTLGGTSEGLFLVTMYTNTNGVQSGSPQTVQITLWNVNSGSSSSPINQNLSFVKTPWLTFYLNPPNEYPFWVWGVYRPNGQ